MKIGFCMLLWTTHVTEKHRPVLEALKATGYDGVEVPVFEGTPDHFERVGRMLASSRERAAPDAPAGAARLPSMSGSWRRNGTSATSSKTG